MTKIDIISGFLGAGKTTFIKQLLKETLKGEKVVLIENEFGEIGIDGGFLEDAGIEIREMNSGCICCSLVGDFGRSLEEVLTKYQPDRVLIEPSGVGKLSDVMNAVREVSSKIEAVLNSAVTVVDASKCRMYMKNFGEFFNNQIENAGTIVLSRTDIADPKKVQAAVDMLREHNKKAAIVTTSCSELSGSQLLELIEKNDDMAAELMAEAKAHSHEHGCGHGEHEHGHGHGCGHGEHGHGHGRGCGHGEHEHGHGCGDEEHEHGHGCGCGQGDHEHGHQHGDGHGHGDHEHSDGCSCGGQEHNHHHAHHHDHHADEVFTSWGRENVTGVSRKRLKEILDELAYSSKYGEVLRAKGMVPTGEDGQWLHFDVVPEQVEIREGAPSYTGKVCVIGADLDTNALAEAFNT